MIAINPCALTLHHDITHEQSKLLREHIYNIYSTISLTHTHTFTYDAHNAYSTHCGPRHNRQLLGTHRFSSIVHADQRLTHLLRRSTLPLECVAPLAFRRDDAATMPLVPRPGDDPDVPGRADSDPADTTRRVPGPGGTCEFSKSDSSSSPLAMKSPPSLMRLLLNRDDEVASFDRLLVPLPSSSPPSLSASAPPCRPSLLRE